MTLSLGTCLPARGTASGATKIKRPSEVWSQASQRRRLLMALCGAPLLAVLDPTRGEEPRAEAEQTIVLDLQYRTGEEILPLIGPHLAGRAVSMSATEDRIFLRGETRELGLAIDLILAMDIPARRLRVTVALVDDDGETIATRETTNGGRETRYSTRATAAPSDSSPQAGRRAASHWRTDQRASRSVLVREGAWAWVSVSRRPTVTRQRAAWIQATPRITVSQAELGGPQLASGYRFRVRPQVAGHRVVLNLAFVGADPAAHANQGLVTTLTARLGEWIRVAGPTDPPVRGTAATLARTRRQELPSVLVRIDPADRL